MKIAFLTPLPPVKSGIAVYSAMLLRELEKRFDVTAVVDQTEVDPPGRRASSPLEGGADHEARRKPAPLTMHEFVRRDREFDLVVAQIGNNPYHETFYRFAMERPAIVVLHDFVLHHLIVEMTLARGDVDGYVASMEASHGAAGGALARARALGIHAEVANFLFPGSIEIARRSQHVVVLNDFGAQRLRDAGVSTPISVTGHPYDRLQLAPDTRLQYRKKLGFVENDRVIGMFGFVTAAKRPEIVFRAFAEAARRSSGLRLLVVGEPGPGIDLSAIAKETGVPDGKWSTTGYVSDHDFDAWLLAVDAVVNLRYPSAGETSGPLVHVLGAKVPVAVSDYASFGTLPGSIVRKVPLGDGEVEALVDFFLDPGRGHDPAAQQRWIDENCSLATVVDQYARIFENPSHGSFISSPLEDALPLLPLVPSISIERAEQKGGAIRIVVRNNGRDSVRSIVFGVPGYRLLVKGVDEKGEELWSEWCSLDRDLGTGEVAEITIRRDASQLHLFHALHGIPLLDRYPDRVVRLA